MKATSSILRRTLLSIIIPEIIFFVVIAFYGYHQVKILLKEIQQDRIESVQQHVHQSLDFKTTSLKAIEKGMRSEQALLLYKLHQSIHHTKRYAEIDLETFLKKEASHMEHPVVNIIDKNGIVINSSNQKDIGLDLFQFGSFYQNLFQLTRKEERFYDFKFGYVPRSGTLVKMGAYPNSTHDIVVMLESGSKDASEILEHIKRDLNRLPNRNDQLMEFDLIYFDEGAPYSFNHGGQEQLDRAKAERISRVFNAVSDTSVLLSNEHDFELYRRFRNPDSRLFPDGVVYLKIDKSWQDIILDNQLKWDGLFFCGVLGVLFIIVYWNTHRITNPIVHLTDKAQKIEEGALHERATVKGTDELAVLSHQFNRMVVQLQENQMELVEINEEISIQRDEIADQKKKIEEAHREITDSINYAQRIQNAILPANSLLKKHLKSHFVWYQPRDVVAGDFYWMETIGETVYFAVADCTGHGVPGALVSMICHNALNRVVLESHHEVLTPAIILNRTRDLVVQEFSKSKTNGSFETEVMDGMDIAMVAFNNNELQFSGANNPLYIVRKNEIQIIKADKQPVGKFQKPYPFTNHEMKLEAGDMLYLFSDGFADQFGGPKNKRYGSRRFREFLIRISIESPETQKMLIANELEAWRKEEEQLDDLCVAGIRYGKISV